MNTSPKSEETAAIAKEPTVSSLSEKYDGPDVRRDSREAFDLGTEAYQEYLDAETDVPRRLTID